MNKFHTTEEEPFIAGSGRMEAYHNQLIKLKDVLILFCRCGHATLSINLQEYHLTENTQVSLLPGSILNLTDIDDDFLLSYACISGKLFLEITVRIEPSFFLFLKENPCYTLPSGHTKGVNGLMNAIEDIYNDRENCFRLQIAKNITQSFLLDVYDKTQRMFKNKSPKGISRQEELFKHFIVLVQKYCSTHREVSFYAAEMFITSRYLSTITQNVTGITAKNIIDKRVILEIKLLLESDNISIQEISNKLYFPDQSFFGRYFKKHTGISPMMYRKMR